MLFVCVCCRNGWGQVGAGGVVVVVVVVVFVCVCVDLVGRL
jgi:hypothetical protein